MTDALTARPNAVISAAIGANSDNLLGADLFRRHESSADPITVRNRLARLSPEIQAHLILQGVFRRIEAIERTWIGEPYTDLALYDAKGWGIPLSSITGKGG